MSDSVVATSYPKTQEYEKWADHADELGMTISEYIQSMVRAGRKEFTIDVDPDETNQELRESRNYYRQKLEEKRRENQKLENQLHGGEAEAIESFVEANPGVTYQEIVEHVNNTASERVSSHLDSMSGNDVSKDGDEYYPIKNQEGKEEEP
ncbi:hypothetical protein [Natronomonas amylolytica]|uniref:hypothetical protein n=1 Tax=Natronomonas amylolytica TaxID=3108498 RepID=UPI00300A29B2